MYTLLASGCLYVSSDIISQCGFSSRADAQVAFYGKATLVHDFNYEKNTVPKLQGSLVLAATGLTNDVTRNFHYWFYNSLHLIVRTNQAK